MKQELYSALLIWSLEEQLHVYAAILIKTKENTSILETLLIIF